MKAYIVYGTKLVHYSMLIKARDYYEACDIADNLMEEDFISNGRDGDEHFEIEIEAEE